MTLTHAETILLLFFETQTVDHAGRLHDYNMNAADFETAKRWTQTGFVQFGRIPAGQINRENGSYPRTHWVILSEAAWTAAHQARRDMAETRLAALVDQRQAS
jgi:hypothetical protein